MLVLGLLVVKAQARDEHGAFSGWSNGFNVIVIQGTNNAPSMPRIDGPISGEAGTAYFYDIVSTDPDDDEIKYLVDWGDGDSDTTGLYDSGYTATVSHSWSESRSYTVRVKAIDEHGAESHWGHITISMPKHKELIIPPFFRFLDLLADKLPLFDVLLKLYINPLIGGI